MMDINEKLQSHAKIIPERCEIWDKTSRFQAVSLTEALAEDVAILFLIFSADAEESLRAVNFPLPEQAAARIKELASRQSAWREVDAEIPSVVKTFISFSSIERSSADAAKLIIEAAYFGAFFILLACWLLDACQKEETYKQRNEKYQKFAKLVIYYMNQQW